MATADSIPYVTLSNGTGSAAGPDGTTYNVRLYTTAEGDIREIPTLKWTWDWLAAVGHGPLDVLLEVRVFTDGPSQLAAVVPEPDAGFHRLSLDNISIVDSSLSRVWVYMGQMTAICVPPPYTALTPGAGTGSILCGSLAK